MASQRIAASAKLCGLGDFAASKFTSCFYILAAKRLGPWLRPAIARMAWPGWPWMAIKPVVRRIVRLFVRTFRLFKALRGQRALILASNILPCVFLHCAYVCWLSG